MESANGHDRLSLEYSHVGWGSSEIFEPPLLRDPIPAEVVKELLAS